MLDYTVASIQGVTVWVEFNKNAASVYILPESSMDWSILLTKLFIEVPTKVQIQENFSTAGNR